MKVGDKVVCIDDSWIMHPAYKGCVLPVKNKIYTIRCVMEWSKRTGILLEEIVNIPIMTAAGYCEIAFNINSFAPIDDSLSETTYEQLMTEIETQELQTA